MKNLFKIIFTILTYLILINVSLANIQNKIIANIGNQIITSHELKNKIITNLILNNQEVNQSNVNNDKQSALRSLVNYKLKKKEVNRVKISTNLEAVNDHLAKISSRYNTDLNGLKNIFLSNNLNFELYIDEIETEFAWQKLIYQLYKEKIFLDKEQINDELKQIIAKQKNLIEYELAEIELLNENTGSDDKIKKLKQEIDLIGFENAAIKYSISPSSMDGGKLGWISINSLSKKIAGILSKMEKDEISVPILRANSILFLKILNKRETNLTQKNIELIKDKIIVSKKNELLNLFANSHLTKIKNNTLINIR